MAMQNEILVARLGQWATRFFGIRGANPLPQLAPEIQPTADVLQPRPDTAVLQSVYLCSGILTVTADGIQVAIGEVENPANSGMMVTVKRLRFINRDPLQLLTTSVLAWAAGLAGTAHLTTVAGIKHCWDSRAKRSPAARLAGARATINISDGSLFSVIPMQAFWTGAAVNARPLDRFTWDGAFPLAPGDALRFNVGDTATDLMMQAEWEERPLFGTETV